MEQRSLTKLFSLFIRPQCCQAILSGCKVLHAHLDVDSLWSRRRTGRDCSQREPQERSACSTHGHTVPANASAELDGSCIEFLVLTESFWLVGIAFAATGGGNPAPGFRLRTKRFDLTEESVIAANYWSMLRRYLKTKDRRILSRAFRILFSRSTT